MTATVRLPSKSQMIRYRKIKEYIVTSYADDLELQRILINRLTVRFMTFGRRVHQTLLLSPLDNILIKSLLSDAETTYYTNNLPSVLRYRLENSKLDRARAYMVNPSLCRRAWVRHMPDSEKHNYKDLVLASLSSGFSLRMLDALEKSRFLVRRDNSAYASSVINHYREKERALKKDLEESKEDCFLRIRTAMKKFEDQGTIPCTITDHTMTTVCLLLVGTDFKVPPLTEKIEGEGWMGRLLEYIKTDDRLKFYREVGITRLFNNRVTADTDGLTLLPLDPEKGWDFVRPGCDNTPLSNFYLKQIVMGFPNRLSRPQIERLVAMGIVIEPPSDALRRTHISDDSPLVYDYQRSLESTPLGMVTFDHVYGPRVVQVLTSIPNCYIQHFSQGYPGTESPPYYRAYTDTKGAVIWLNIYNEFRSRLAEIPGGDQLVPRLAFWTGSGVVTVDQSREYYHELVVIELVRDHHRTLTAEDIVLFNETLISSADTLIKEHNHAYLATTE